MNNTPNISYPDTIDSDAYARYSFLLSIAQETVRSMKPFMGYGTFTAKDIHKKIKEIITQIERDAVSIENAVESVSQPLTKFKDKLFSLIEDTIKSCEKDRNNTIFWLKRLTEDLEEMSTTRKIRMIAESIIKRVDKAREKPVICKINDQFSNVKKATIENYSDHKLFPSEEMQFEWLNYMWKEISYDEGPLKIKFKRNQVFNLLAKYKILLNIPTKERYRYILLPQEDVTYPPNAYLEGTIKYLDKAKNSKLAGIIKSNGADENILMDISNGTIYFNSIEEVSGSYTPTIESNMPLPFKGIMVPIPMKTFKKLYGKCKFKIYEERSYLTGKGVCSHDFTMVVENEAREIVTINYSIIDSKHYAAYSSSADPNQPKSIKLLRTKTDPDWRHERFRYKFEQVYGPLNYSTDTADNNKLNDTVTPRKIPVPSVNKMPLSNSIQAYDINLRKFVTIPRDCCYLPVIKKPIKECLDKIPDIVT